MQKKWLIFLMVFIPTLVWAGGTKDRAEQDISHKDRKLLEMIQAGDDKAVQNALQLDLDLDYTDNNGRTALHAAAEFGEEQVVKSLLNLTKNIDPQDNNGRTPLFLAVENNHAQAVELFMNYNADPAIMNSEGICPATLALERSQEIIQLVLKGDTAKTLRIDGSSLLHIVAEKGNPAKVKILLELGAMPDVRNANGETPLDVALGTDDLNHAAVAALLLREGSPEPLDSDWTYITEPLRTGMYDIRFNFGSTALHISIDKGQKGMAEYLVANGAKTDLLDEPGNSPLQIAVGKGYLSLAKILIEHGAEVNTFNESGDTPLHVALNLPNPKAMIALLLDNGADPNMKNSQGHTPLHFLVLLSADPDIAKMLIDGGAEIDPRDNAGNTPLLLAIESGLNEKIDENHRMSAELLLSNHADIYAKNNKGVTPVVYALKTKSSNWFFTNQSLVEPDNEGKMTLHHAIINKIDLDELIVILNTGIDPNLQDFNGNTALHYAVQYHLIDHAKQLLASGSDMFRLNNAKLSPLTWVFREGTDLTLDLLSNDLDIEDEFGSTPLYYAIEAGNEQIVLALLEAGADASHSNGRGITPLHKTVHANNAYIAEILLSYNADPNSGDSMGRTPFHEAVIWNKRDMVRLLGAGGADINAKDKAGQTGLHLAIRKETGSDMCKLLISMGVPLNTRDNSGKTPLFLATESGKNTIVDYLVANGAYLDSRDNEGRTALLSAIHSNSDAGALSLVRAGADIFAVDSSGKTPFDLIMGKGDSARLFVTPEIVNRQDNNGNTPLHLAVLSNASPEFINLLLERRADKSIQNSRRQTPFKLAEIKGNEKLMKLLR